VINPMHGVDAVRHGPVIDARKKDRTRASVLVIEDEPAVRRLLVHLLTSQGYAVHEVGDGASAMAVVRKRHPDLILLDVGLPDMDGFEVCRTIKGSTDTRLIPVVMVTGLHDREARIRGIEAGADDFLAKPFDQAELLARVASLVRIKQYTDDLESAECIIQSLALTVEARDPYTQGHCERLALYASALGRELGLQEDEIAALERGGYLHDVGKIGIPDSILQKPSRLTTEEFDFMKTHTFIGERLCGQLRTLVSVRPIVRSHHERRDGNGYPDGLRGDEIPLLAQIISIVDEYDAITTTRPYRAALPAEHAYSELTAEVASGIHSANLVDAFIAVAKRGGLDVIDSAQVGHMSEHGSSPTPGSI